MALKHALGLTMAIVTIVAFLTWIGSPTDAKTESQTAAAEGLEAPLNLTKAPPAASEGTETAATKTDQPNSAQEIVGAPAAASRVEAEPAPPKISNNRSERPDGQSPSSPPRPEPVTAPAPTISNGDSGPLADAGEREDQIVIPPAAPRTISAPVSRDVNAAPPPPPEPRYVTIPEGTPIEVRLEERLTSDGKSTGDLFKARLDRDIEVDGEVVFPAGTEVTGKIVEAVEAGRVEGRARLEMALDTLTRDGEDFQIHTNPIAVEAEGSKGRDAKIIGGAAAIGALIGAITGGKKGAAVGAASGAGAGTAGVLVTKGDKVDLPQERLLSFRLEEPFEVRID